MIELKSLKENQFELFYSWINDAEVIKYSLSKFQKINSREEIKNWFNALIQNKVDLNLGIYLKDNKQLIGYCGICKISKTNHSGEYFIFIGDKKSWGKGISTEATKQVLAIGFTKLNLNRIMLTVSEPNIGGVKSYHKAGFKEEGILREACFRDHSYHNKIIMSILKKEWSVKLNQFD